jgi:hypothetical protein
VQRPFWREMKHRCVRAKCRQKDIQVEGQAAMTRMAAASRTHDPPHPVGFTDMVQKRRSPPPAAGAFPPAGTDKVKSTENVVAHSAPAIAGVSFEPKASDASNFLAERHRNQSK